MVTPRSLTVPARDILIEHLDGRKIGIKKTGERGPGEYQAYLSLLTNEYIAVERGVAKPAYTEITDKGRAALASALADWADAIERAQIDEIENPVLTAIIERAVSPLCEPVSVTVPTGHPNAHEIV